MTSRRPLVHVAVGVLLVGLLALVPPPDADALLGIRPPAPVDGVLAEVLATTAPADEVVAVVSTAGAATLVAPVLELLGLDAQPMQELPAVVVRGVPTTLLAARTVAGVTGLWANTPLHQVLAQSRQQIGAEEVHTAPDLGFTGAGVGVAVLDSGIEATHPDLAFGTKVVQNVKVLGYQKLAEGLTLTVEDLPDTDTTSGHGTHVAGIAAGDGTASDGLHRGVAPGADLIGVGSGEGVEMVTALAGYDWILANHETYGIRVINNSWADGTIPYDPAHPLNVASKAAHAAGIVVVFAAGNDGQAGGNVLNRFAWPDWVIAVGGVDKNGVLGDYSSRGDAEHHADVVAPGTFIASTMARTGVVGLPNQSPLDATDPLAPRVLAPEHIPFYTVKIGTSMAAPHVAGVAALMLEANPTLTPDQVIGILRDTARPISGCVVVDCGSGLVDAAAAVRTGLGAAVQAPTATVAGSPTLGAAPLDVTWDATASTDADGTVVEWRWDLGADGDVDVVTPTGLLARTYAPGVHRMAVTVIDDDGLASAPSPVVEVRASAPPVASATAPRHARSGEAFAVDASASVDPDGSIVSYRVAFSDGTEIVSSTPVVQHVVSTTAPVRVSWTVVVTDDAGLQDAVSGSTKVTPGS